MFHCVLCKFNTELDDVSVQARSGFTCICLKCYARETNTAISIDKKFITQVMEIAAAYAYVPDPKPSSLWNFKQGFGQV